MITLYHNPRCSKSRAALAILEAQSKHPFEIVTYLKTPRSHSQWTQLFADLALSEPQTILRRNEAEYAQAQLGDQPSVEQIIEALIQYPKLMERPILQSSGQALIGRPTELIEPWLEQLS